MMNKFKASCSKSMSQVKEGFSSLLPLVTPPPQSENVTHEEAELSGWREMHVLPSRRVAPSNELDVLMRAQRKGMECLLSQADSVDKDSQIGFFLKESLDQIRRLVEPLLNEHQALVTALKLRKLSHGEAREQSNNLQEQLDPFFKKKLFLLFHPDKYHTASESIKRVQHELVIQVQALYKRSLDQLLAGIKTIQDFTPCGEFVAADYERLLQSYRDLYQGFLDDYTAFYERESVRHEAHMEFYKQESVRHEAHMEFYKQEKVKHKAWEVRHKAWEVRHEALEVRDKAMNAEIQELKSLYHAHMALQKSDALDVETETSEASPRVFPVRP